LNGAPKNPSLHPDFKNVHTTLVKSAPKDYSQKTILPFENLHNKLNGSSKDPSLHPDFKNVHMTLVKSAPKKSYSQKTILPIENLHKS